MQFYENSIFFLSKSKVIVLSCFSTKKSSFPWESSKLIFFTLKNKVTPVGFFSTHLKLPKKGFQTSPTPAFTPPFWVICHIPYLCFLKQIPCRKKNLENLYENRTKIKTFGEKCCQNRTFWKKIFFNVCSIFVKNKTIIFEGLGWVLNAWVLQRSTPSRTGVLSKITNPCVGPLEGDFY